MLTAYKKFWKQYADFSGRSSRSDFWWVMLWHALIAGIPMFLAFFIMIASGLSALAYSGVESFDPEAAVGGGAIFALLIWVLVIIYGLATLVPNIALSVRRLRDGGYHWAFVFLAYGPMLGSFIPLLNYLILLVGFPCQIAFLVLASMPTKEVGGVNGGYNQSGFQGQQFGQNQQNFQGQPFNQGQQPVQNQPFGSQGQQNFQGQQFAQNQQNFQGQQENAQQGFGGQAQQPFQNQPFGQAQESEPSQPFGQTQQTEPTNPFNQAQQPFGQAQEVQQPFGAQSQQAAQPQQTAQPEQSVQNDFTGETQQVSQGESVFGQQFNVSSAEEQATPQEGPVQTEPFIPEAFQNQAETETAQPETASSEETQE